MMIDRGARTNIAPARWEANWVRSVPTRWCFLGYFLADLVAVAFFAKRFSSFLRRFSLFLARTPAGLPMVVSWKRSNWRSLRTMLDDFKVIGCRLAGMESSAIRLTVRPKQGVS